MDDLTATRLFLRVAESGSFSAVAREFGLSQPTVSKAIAALEHRLSAQLMRRTSRSLSLTEAGQMYYEGARKAVSDLDAAAMVAKQGSAGLAGTLRVTMSAGFGRLHVFPLMREFCVENPNLDLEITISDRFIDLIEEGIDLAIRISDLPDSRLIARKIGVSRRGTFGSASYFDENGIPVTPSELSGHRCIGFVANGSPRPWAYQRADEVFTITPQGQMRANDAELIREAVVSGFGLASAPSWLFAREVAGGPVIEVLKEWDQAAAPIQAVYPATKMLPQKVRAFIDFLANGFAANPHVRAAAGP